MDPPFPRSTTPGSTEKSLQRGVCLVIMGPIHARPVIGIDALQSVGGAVPVCSADSNSDGPSRSARCGEAASSRTVERDRDGEGILDSSPDTSQILVKYTGQTDLGLFTGCALTLDRLTRGTRWGLLQRRIVAAGCEAPSHAQSRTTPALPFLTYDRSARHSCC